MSEPRHRADTSLVQPSHHETQENYDRLSRWYDLFSASEEAFNRRGIELLELEEGERVLEVGYGTGRSLVRIARLVGTNGLTAGIDISTGMAQVAQVRLQKEKVSSSVPLCTGDALRLPYKPACLDAVFCAFFLELLETQEISPALAEIQRVLRIGGRLGIVGLSLPEQPGKIVRIYEWLHQTWPKILDCRPIPIERWIRERGFSITRAECKTMWGLPVETVIGVKV